jgi:hypothetical protein
MARSALVGRGLAVGLRRFGRRLRRLLRRFKPERSPSQGFGERDKIGLVSELHAAPHLIAHKPAMADVVRLVGDEITDDHGQPQVNWVLVASVKRP